MLRYFRRALFFVVLLMCGQVVFASSISPLSSQIKFISSSSYPADFLYVEPPSASGISINRFSSFSVSGKALSIVNPGSIGVTPTTIVIIADDIYLRDKIDIVGDAADIVFLTPDSGGKIECTSCAVHNALRLTLAVTSEEPDLSSSKLGVFKVSGNGGGKVTIDGMSAPGAINVDVLSGKVFTDGSVSLHQSVNRDSRGGYVADENGSLVMGTGSLQFLIGTNHWNYDDQVLVGLSYSTATTSEISGTLKAVGIKLTSSGPLNIDATMDTTTDAVSTVRYKGIVLASPEQVHISDFSSSSLGLSGLSINSHGNVSIKTENNLTLPLSSNLVGSDVELISDKAIYNYGNTLGDKLAVGGAEVFNEGQFEANSTLEIWSDEWIINRSGGLIMADVIRMETGETNNSFVINGSRTPYEQDPNGLLDIDEQYFDSIDHTKIGTYYTAGLHNVSNFSGLSTPPETSAHILGRNITIKTQAFENINPYFELIEEFGAALVVDRNLINQISVIAEDKLEIDAKKYILNSSALLGTEGGDSLVHLQTPTLSNERYRVLAMLDMDFYSETGDLVNTGDWKNGEPIYSNDTTTTETIQTKMAAFSPPGVLYSMGNFQFSSEDTSNEHNGLFLNSIGYFEVFKDAKFNTGRVIDAGIENHSIVRSERVRDYTLGLRTDNISSRDYVTNPEEMDSLFYVGGVARAAQTDSSQFLNYSPFKGYLSIVLQDLLGNYDHVGTYSSINAPSGNYNLIHSEHGLNNTLEIWLEPGTDLTQLEDEFTINWWETRIYLGARENNNNIEDFQVSVQETDTYSIFDELKSLFERLVDSFIETFNELKWW